jgi:hypothetical protein
MNCFICNMIVLISFEVEWTISFTLRLFLLHRSLYFRFLIEFSSFIYDTYGVYNNCICYFHTAFNCYLVTTSEAQRSARGAGIVTPGVQ